MAVVREIERVARVIEQALVGLVADDDDRVLWDVTMTEVVDDEDGDLLVPAVMLWIGLGCYSDPTSMHTMRSYIEPGEDEECIVANVRDSWEHLTFHRVTYEVEIDRGA